MCLDARLLMNVQKCSAPERYVSLRLLIWWDVKFRLLAKLGFVEMMEPAANGTSVTACAVPPSLEGEGFEVPHPLRFSFTPGTHMYKPRRLQRDLKRNDAAILQRDSSAASGNSENPPAIDPPRMQPQNGQPPENGGGPGEAVFASPRRLCATFDARKWLSSCGTFLSLKINQSGNHMAEAALSVSWR